MKKTTVTFMVLLALLLAIPWTSYAGHGHGSNTSVFISGSFSLGPPNGSPYGWSPSYYYGAPVYYDPPPVIVPQTAVYLQRGQDQSDYWYYCDNPRGFYPYTQSCPGGWMKVIPETAPPNR